MPAFREKVEDLIRKEKLIRPASPDTIMHDHASSVKR
jgi:hypothetical protein